MFLTAVHGFTQAMYDVIEDGRLFTQLEINVKGTSTQFFDGYTFIGSVVSEAGTASEL